MATVNRQWRLSARPDGLVGPQNFSLTEGPVPEVEEGGVLLRNLMFSFDPTQRGWMEDRPSYIPPVGIGELMRATGVGEVIESRHPDFAPGDLAQGMLGWQDYCAVAATGPLLLTKLPEGVEPELALSVLGLTGLTAWFGLLDLGQPEEGETVLVSGAAGATGSVAAQIARIKGCRVVGIAGGPDKCRWLDEQAKLDASIDYKSEDVPARLRELCPDGIDVYFDNVGGPILEAALDQIALGARIVLCGGISGYNEKTPPPGPRNLMNLILRRGRMEGFIIIDYAARFGEAVPQLLDWVRSGELAYAVDVQEGLENAPATLRRLFEGKNLGKQLLRIAEPSVA
jgi:NADPH-dependent curcumin reductase CurA